PVLVADQVAGLAGGHHHQEPPQVIAVRQLGEAAVLGALAKAVERAQGHVFLVGSAPGSPLEFLPRQSNQALEVALPQRLCCHGIAGLEQADPVGYRALRWHGRSTPIRPDGTMTCPCIVGPAEKSCKRKEGSSGTGHTLPLPGR